MKVIAINGSPKKEGNTLLALSIIGNELKAEGIEFEILYIGIKPFTDAPPAANVPSIKMKSAARLTT